VLLKDNMFLLQHLILQQHQSGEGTNYPSGAPKWRRNILSFRSTEVEKEHLILQEHLSGEGTYYPSGVLLKDKMFLLHLCAPEG
jgi:hypothetical protein